MVLTSLRTILSFSGEAVLFGIVAALAAATEGRFSTEELRAWLEAGSNFKTEGEETLCAGSPRSLNSVLLRFNGPLAGLLGLSTLQGVVFPRRR